MPDIRNHAISGTGIFVGDVFPDLGKIDFGLWMEIVAGYAGGLNLRASLFSRNRAKTSSPGMSFTLPVLISS